MKHALKFSIKGLLLLRPFDVRAELPICRRIAERNILFGLSSLLMYPMLGLCIAFVWTHRYSTASFFIFLATLLLSISGYVKWKNGLRSIVLNDAFLYLLCAAIFLMF